MIPEVVILKRSDISNSHENIRDNMFISDKRRSELLRYNNCYRSVHGKTSIYLYLKKDDPDKWKSMLRLVFGRVDFMRKLCNNKKPLLIHIWPTPWRKSFPKSKIFTEDDINSGSSTTLLGTKDNGYIYLWRKEEILKVLVHEIIHAFRIDEKDPSPKEAYVELKAILANLYLELLERRIPLSEYSKYIQKEKDFGLKQCRKIREYDPGKTNILAYLDERNRLLNRFSKNKWEILVKRKKQVPSENLRFSIAEVLLNKISPRQDIKRKVLIIP